MVAIWHAGTPSRPGVFGADGRADDVTSPTNLEEGTPMKRVRTGFAVAAALAVMAALPAVAAAHEPSGAIFTTLSDGSEVNFNHYDLKTDVYLDGGPGPGAPQTAAGLDDGTYVFQVTDPSGKTLLSTDIAACRQFTVANGVINGVVGPCPHVTGVDVDHNAVTVQLFPFNDTPEQRRRVQGVGHVPRGLRLQPQRGRLRLHPWPRTATSTALSPGTARPTTSRSASSRWLRSTPGSTSMITASMLLDNRGVTWSDPLGASRSRNGRTGHRG